MIHEVVSELDNIPNFNDALRHRAIDWLIENSIKFAIIKDPTIFTNGSN